VTLRPHHIRIASDNSQFRVWPRGHTLCRRIKAGTEDCVCRDTNTIVPLRHILQLSLARRVSDAGKLLRFAAPSRRDLFLLSANIGVFRQDRAARGEEIFCPKGPVTGPAVYAAVELILNSPQRMEEKVALKNQKRLFSDRRVVTAPVSA
jgi:hypothetical protein